jgi:HD superfamily phosphohydrolase
MLSICAFWTIKNCIKDPSLIWVVDPEDDVVLKEIINSDVIQRLKKIDQSGPPRYFGPKLPAFSRYDHSLGVLAILQKAGASKFEQISGLLHDSSHTVFSHLGDYLFAKKKITKYTEKSYQDSTHLTYLQTKAGSLLKKLNIKVEDIDPNNEKFTMLEQSLPDMCADRIQYNIHTGLLFGIISHREARDVVADLQFNDGKWFFTNPVLAKKFATLSVRFTQEFWGAKWNVMMNIHMKNAVKRAIKLGLITGKDIFSTDDIVLDKLSSSDDEIIKLNLRRCDKHEEEVDDPSFVTEQFYPKFRGIDPLVQTESGLVRLTEIDADFKAYYERVKGWCAKGYSLRVDPNS